MHTQHFPKTVLFTSQRGQGDRGTAKVLLLVLPKQHRHTSLALQQAGQPLLFTPESNSFTRELKQMAPHHTDVRLDQKWNMHGRLPPPPISAATDPTDHQLKHSQHHQTHSVMSTLTEFASRALTWWSRIDLFSSLYSNSSAGNSSKMPRTRASCCNLCCTCSYVSEQPASLPCSHGASSDAVWGRSKHSGGK